MDRDPKTHPFSPRRPGDDACRWCPYHKNAHIEQGETVTWICSRCFLKIDGNPPACPRCNYTVYSMIKE